MVDKDLVNQLLDALEELLIDNSAYRTALTTLDRYLPPQARQLADQMITAAKADPKLREMIHGQFATFRDQSLEKALEGLLTIVQPMKDMN